MTEPTDIDALIAEARDEADLATEHESRRAEPTLMRDLADALESTAAELRQERERADDLEDRLSGYLCDSTGGKLSKTGYDVRTMVSHTEEYYDDIHAEDRKVVEADLARAREVIDCVRAVTGDVKYGHDIEWVRMNLRGAINRYDTKVKP